MWDRRYTHRPRNGSIRLVAVRGVTDDDRDFRIIVQGPASRYCATCDIMALPLSA